MPFPSVLKYATSLLTLLCFWSLSCSSILSPAGSDLDKAKIKSKSLSSLQCLVKCPTQKPVITCLPLTPPVSSLITFLYAHYFSQIKLLVDFQPANLLNVLLPPIHLTQAVLQSQLKLCLGKSPDHPPWQPAVHTVQQYSSRLHSVLHIHSGRADHTLQCHYWLMVYWFIWSQRLCPICKSST